MKLNWAERWAVNNPFRPLFQRVELSWVEKVIESHGQARGTTPQHGRHPGAVLEVGCGRGAGARLILQKFQPDMLNATDLDLEMMQKALKYLSTPERERVALSVADALHLPFRDGSMDAVVGFGVLHHIVAWRDALTEIVRVLKGGGMYLLEEIYPPLYQNIITRRLLLHPREDRFRSEDLRRALRAVGLEIMAAKESRYLGILAILQKEGTRQPGR